MLESQRQTYASSQSTLKLITRGRITGLPHIAELRYTTLEGSFYVLAGNSKSDWLLNALSNPTVRLKIGETIYTTIALTASVDEKERVLEQFRGKYGSRIIQQWYGKAGLSLRLDPVGPPVTKGVTKSEAHTLEDSSKWDRGGLDYYGTVEQAFDSASEEYDYTINRNYINSWIRKRSLDELFELVRPEDVLLEIGCGTGAEAVQISKRAARIIATDISEKMLELLRTKVHAKKLERKITGVRVRASNISSVRSSIPDGRVRIAYSFNGALNCEPDISQFPEQLSSLLEEQGYFVCSIRNTLCLSEIVSHSIVFQFDNPRKKQPTMVSVGGMDVPSYYYPPHRFSQFFQPYFHVRKIIGLPAILPPAYLNEYYLKTGIFRRVLEKLELSLADYFPLNIFGDQTLFVFQKR